MPSVIMLSVKNKFIMLNLVKLSAIMLSVVMQNVVAPDTKLKLKNWALFFL